MDALITGTPTHPCVLVTVRAGDVHAGTGEPIGSWIRSLPRIRRAADGRWQLLAVGPDAATRLAEAGFAAVLDGPLADAGVTLDELARPLAVPDATPGRLRVHPRLAGVTHTSDLLGDVGTVDAGTGDLTAPTSRVRPCPAGIAMAAATSEGSWPPDLPDAVRDAAGRLAAATELDSAGRQADYRLVTGLVGDVPTWFGLDLDPYQRAGAVAAAAGHSAVCDPPGLGKTRTLLAALAIRGCRRTVLITPPPPVVTHWQRETELSRLAQHAAPGGTTVTLIAGRKLPELPDAGVVIVPDSLLGARPDIVERLVGWRPDGVAVDEVHRAKTWTALRSRAVRTVSRSCTGIRLAASGTPMLANVHEMCSMLAVTGHLSAVFGGLDRFERDYCRQNHFGGWSSRRRALPRLKELLDRHVWVRRGKDMPVAKHRRVEFIEPDPAVWTSAHAEVHRTIDRFLTRALSTTGSPPTPAQIQRWASGQLGLITQMRRAAGLAKVHGIAEHAANWVCRHTDHDTVTGQSTYRRPLIIWTWHQEVSEALALAVPHRVGSAGVIIGSTAAAERSRLVDEFQDGRLAVLVCSIPTVGVGVTLTRSADCWFAESSFTPAEISQAEDRAWRRGQDRDVRVTTFIAPGTLDERIQSILARKASVLDTVLAGGDNDVAVLDRQSRAEAEDLLVDLVLDRLRRMSATPPSKVRACAGAE